MNSDSPEEVTCKCGITFGSGVTKKEHLQMIIENSSNNKIPCENCLDKLTEPDPGMSTLMCFVCNDTLKAKEFFINHILQYHIPSAPYSCDLCQEKFKLKPFLKMHRCDKHPKEDTPSFMTHYYGNIAENVTTSTFTDQDQNFRKVTRMNSDSPEEVTCGCGITFGGGVTKKEHLQMIIQNSSNDKIPCEICLDKITEPDPGMNALMCFVCSNTFKVKEFLINHITQCHIPSAPYGCDHCQEKFKLKLYLDMHRCGKRLKEDTRYSSKYHNENIARNEVYDKPSGKVCHLCGKKYKQRQKLLDHIESAHQDKKHPCPLCKKEFRTKRRVYQHIRRLHEGLEVKKNESVKVECDICHHTMSKAYLTTHIKSKHGTPGDKESLKKFKCKICGAGFKAKNTLENHQNSNHTGAKPYVCETCGKSFSSDISFKRHQVTHTGEKKYKCDTCGVSFNQKCTLTRHQVVHTGEKPFECGICGQRFTQKPYMQAHERKCKDGKTATVKRKKKKNDSFEESDETSDENEEFSEEDEVSDDKEESCSDADMS